MKKISLTILTILFTSLIFACSCEYGGNFLHVAKFSETIVKAKVIEHVYHTSNGERFKTLDEQIRSMIDNDLDQFYGTGESIRIEILELIRGTEKRKIIEIFSTDGADCRASTRDYKVGEIYVMSIYQPKRPKPKLPNETNSDYAIGGCSENSLIYLPETDEVFGMIKGKSYRKSARKYSYGKLIAKIT